MTILTTEHGFSKISSRGCLNCGNKNFIYYDIVKKVICKKCYSKYIIVPRNIIELLNTTEKEIKLYRPRILIDDDKIDTTIKITKQKRLKKEKI